MFGDVKVNDLTALVTENDECEEQTKGHGRDDKEIDGGNLRRVIREKIPPALRRRFPLFPHVLRNRRLGYLITEKAKLGANSWRTPRWILPRHAANQLTGFKFHLRPTNFYSRLPSPVESEALPVPANDRLRFDDQEHALPARPESGEPGPENAVASSKPRPLHRTPEHGQLLSERQVLRDKRRSASNKDTQQRTDFLQNVHPLRSPFNQDALILTEKQSTVGAS